MFYIDCSHATGNPANVESVARGPGARTGYCVGGDIAGIGCKGSLAAADRLMPGNEQLEGFKWLEGLEAIRLESFKRLECLEAIRLESFKNAERNIVDWVEWVELVDWVE